MGNYENGKKVIEIITTYNVKSDEQKYYFAIKMIKCDTFDENNNGIHSVNIINANDWHEEHVYGVKEHIAGIHIASDY